MFNISPMELMLVCVVALLVIGPDKLPGAIRTGSLWLGRFRRSYNKVKSEIERELNTDEIKRQLHNEAVLEDIEEAKAHVKKIADETQLSVDSLVTSSNFDPGVSSATESQAVRDLECPGAEEPSGAPGMTTTRPAAASSQAEDSDASNPQDTSAATSTQETADKDSAAPAAEPKRSTPRYGSGVNPKLAQPSAAKALADSQDSSENGAEPDSKPEHDSQ